MIIKNTKDGNWGLDRIDQFYLPLNNYYQTSRSGSNVDVCIIDTGIARNHSEFGSIKIETLYDFRNTLPPNDPNYIDQNSIYYGYDDHGHGTFISSIITGRNYGVASRANLYSVKVFDRNLKFNINHLLEGLDKVLQFHLNKTPFRPTILCLPFSDISYSLTLENKIIQLYNSGIIIIGSAGNKGIDVKDSFPANMKEVFAVAGSDFNDNFMNPAQLTDPSFSENTLSGIGNSNYGSKILVIAPGFKIKGAWIPKEINNIGNSITNQKKIHDFNIISGNSVSCAFVVGVACLYFQENQNASSSDFENFIKTYSTKNVLKIKKEYSSTPNRLLRMPYKNLGIKWSVKDNEYLGYFNEGESVDLKISSGLIDITGKSVEPKYSLFSGSLPSGLQLLEDGSIVGKLNLIDSTEPGYVPKNSLPLEEQQLFAENQVGYIDYTFSIMVDFEFTSSVRTLKIRVIDLNVPPEWIFHDFFNINEYFPPYTFYYKNYVNIDISNIVVDENNDNIHFTILNNQLPENLTLTTSGKIIGTVKSFFPSSINYPLSAGLIKKDYYFTIRATDGYEKIDKWCKLTIFRDGTNNSPPEILTNGYDISSLGTFYKGIPLQIPLEIEDSDEDFIQLIEVSAYVSGIGLSSNNVFFGLPEGLKILNNSIEGIIDYSVPAGIHYFGIAAFDGWDETRKTFSIIVEEINVSSLNSFARLRWITTSGSLGHIYETYPSYFFVKGYSINNSQVEYTLLTPPNSLPPGLILQKNGLIKGITGYVSADKTFEFIVKMNEVSNPSIYITRKFSITVKKKWGQTISEFYYYLSGEDKYMIVDFIRNQARERKVVNDDILYRVGDENYDKSINPKIFILGGTKKFNEVNLFNLFNVEEPSNTTLQKSYFRPIELTIGEFKNANVRDFQGNLIAELIYLEMYEENYQSLGVTSSAKIIYNNPIQNHIMDEFYVSNIETWRNKIKLDGGLVNNEEKLPLWMISPQSSAKSLDIPGFVRAIELFYVNLGHSDNIVLLLKRMFSDLIYGKKIKIDRLVYEELEDQNNPKKRIIKFPPGDK